MKRVIIMRGLPGSGKSTYAKKLVKDHPNVYKRINRDDLRAMFDQSHFSKSNEKFVRQVRDMLIVKALEDGKSVIVDDTNLSSKNENRIRQLVSDFIKEHGHEVKVEIKEMDTSLADCIERDAKREKPVGAKVIRRMHQQFYAKDRAYRIQDETLPNAIICDLDGTLAILNGRDPYHADNCDKDLLNEPVADLVKLKAANGTTIILLSGRLDTYKPQTLIWLEKHGIPYDRLYMREAKDNRKDAIVKKAFFQQYIENQFFIEFVLDDRNQVVDLWREDLNLPCFQVYYGDF